MYFDFKTISRQPNNIPTIFVLTCGSILVTPEEIHFLRFSTIFRGVYADKFFVLKTHEKLVKN